MRAISANRIFVRSRRGETDNKTVLIIVLSVLGVLILIGCLIFLIPCLMATFLGTAVTLPAVQQARDAARRTQSQNNLKQVGLGMHNFHDANGHWVGGTTGADGELAHSWQTQLLPWVDQAALHQTIDLEVAWDDPDQTGAFQVVIPQYQNPGETEMFTSSGFATSHYAGNVNVLLTDSELTLGDVIDGTSQTIAAGEVTSGLKAWGDPTNLRDPSAGIGRGPDQFGSSSPDGANMLLMDGSVRFISGNVSPEVLQGLSTPDGGEAVGPF